MSPPLDDAEVQMCSCGRALHYQDYAVYRRVQELIDVLGERIEIRTEDGGWLVPRHYIALHGLSAAELPSLAKRYGFEAV